jgi:transposase
MDLEWVQRLAAGGLTKKEIAEAVGISLSTLMDYQTRYPEFLEAINQGRRRDIQDIEDAVHRAAKGYTFMEEKLQYDTQIGKWARETVIKHSNPDIKAALAILLHNETGSWKPKTETELKFPEPLVIKSLSTGKPIESLGLEAPPDK